MSEETARQLILTGRVQGVGFRPFVYRLAHRLALAGWVRNVAGRVEIQIQGAQLQIARFVTAVITEAPPLARPVLHASLPLPCSAEFLEFRIVSSHSGSPQQASVPPDMFACADCLQELHDPQARRHGYPFINCTQCGPRYTLINALPYDRPQTTMAGFTLCPACRQEYQNPLDRRFHAQPLACPECGPWLLFQTGGEQISGNEAALTATIHALRQGQIVAVKGVGGYHLLCDAQNETAVTRLRQRKPRPHKPLAVMVADDPQLVMARSIARISPEQAACLQDPLRPIVLVSKRPNTPLAPAIAPMLDEIGLLLAYSPLHHLLLRQFAAPLVATSANVSGEPVLTDSLEVEQRLGLVADAFLHHNRPIRRPADDPVLRVIANTPLPLRLGRGSAPLELTLPFTIDKPLLAVGGQDKNTVALAWDNRVVVSPHIGTLATPRGLAVFQQVVVDLQALYSVQAAALVHDLHPGYDVTRWAQQQGMPTVAVGHHAAHASALAGEQEVQTTALVFTWDAVGLGPDGRL